jgi:hypothetical protein
VSSTKLTDPFAHQSCTTPGVATIFEEKASGTKRTGRTDLEKVLGVLGEGDTLVGAGFVDLMGDVGDPP